MGDHIGILCAAIPKVCRIYLIITCDVKPQVKVTYIHTVWGREGEITQLVYCFLPCPPTEHELSGNKVIKIIVIKFCPLLERRGGKALNINCVHSVSCYCISFYIFVVVVLNKFQ